jgi:hypothetical protein
MDSAKLRLSAEEMDLISRADWILTKNRLMEKLGGLFATIQEEQLRLLQKQSNPFPVEVIASSGKITRGENYEGLPWMVLDQPRYFTKDHQMAIRCLFWWGNGFSITLQLMGRYRQQYAAKILKARDSFIDHSWSICTSRDPWQHHHRDDYYSPISQLPEDEWIRYVHEHPFLKLAKFIPVQQWDDAPDILLRQYQLLMQLLG